MFAHCTLHIACNAHAACANLCSSNLTSRASASISAIFISFVFPPFFYLFFPPSPPSSTATYDIVLTALILCTPHAPPIVSAVEPREPYNGGAKAKAVGVAKRGEGGKRVGAGQ